jgi:hypothetical protein
LLATCIGNQKNPAGDLYKNPEIINQTGFSVFVVEMGDGFKPEN